MTILFQAMPTEYTRSIQNGALDANGQIAELAISDGGGNPCRHCLTEIPSGANMLVLAYRPFPNLQPYAESGPVFICAEHCNQHEETGEIPQMFKEWDQLMIRGYGSDNRIVYGSGKIVETEQIKSVVEDGFENPKIRYFHLRSASNNCFQVKISRSII